ncbi:MAG: hypothetical protein PGN07_05105 [Aeromicrobium erythreum]
MPRRQRRRPAPARFEPETQLERRDGRAWHVRRLSGATSAKTYTCPACSRAIEPGTGHVVVWPVEKALLSASALDERRHWHHDCWQRLR